VRDKLCNGPAEALADLNDGATLLVGGFGDSGIPLTLLSAIRESGIRDLTIVSINAGRGNEGIAGLIAARQVRRIICTFPRTAGSVAFEEAYAEGRLLLDLVPMGTLVERLRAAGAGIPAFYTSVSAGTALAEGKETRNFAGRCCVLETALHGDVAIIAANRADRFGNLTYSGTARNLNPVLAKAARLSIAEVNECLPLGTLCPEEILTPGVYVDRLVLREASLCA
jgi:3-oxoacid CoA-transferase A subunit